MPTHLCQPGTEATPLEAVTGALGLRLVPTSAADGAETAQASCLARGRRVCLLTAFVVLVGIADLGLTLTLLLNWGLSEGNPLARAVMSYNSPGVVVAWKLLTLGLGCTILLRLRARPVAELGAWVCFGLMVWLTFQWGGYMSEMESILATTSEPGQVVTDETWVSMVPNTIAS
ncbi:MAG: DUF5658 family protein [Planctomycetota bacterium]